MPITVSVVTPSFNQARYLEETLRSVLSQRDQIHEYFVIDGGSTDRSVDIIRKYAAAIDYWTSEKDRGQSDAIQKGFNRATGDVIAWLNSDDVYLPGAIAKVRQAFERHPQWDVITSDYVLIDGQTRLTGLYRRPPQSRSWARWGQWLICQQGCFFRRSLFEKAGGLDLSLHCMMDADLWARFFRLGANWGHSGDYLAAFRWHQESKTMSWSRSWEEDGAVMRQRYPEFHPGALRRRLGRIGYLFRQAVSGRQLRATWDTWRYRGRPLTEVFGDWSANVPTPAAGSMCVAAGTTA